MTSIGDIPAFIETSVSSPETAKSPAEPSVMSERIMALASAVEWRRITSFKDLEAIERLRYACYLKEGAILRNETKRLGDRFDQEPRTSVFGFYLQRQLIASIRVHVLDATSAASPTVLAFPDAIEPMIATGQTLIDSSRFVIDAEASHHHPKLAYIVLRAPLMVIQALAATGALAAVRREHMPFYTRLLRMKPIREPRPYLQLTKPLGLCYADCGVELAGVLERNPFLLISGNETARMAEITGAWY